MKIRRKQRDIILPQLLFLVFSLAMIWGIVCSHHFLFIDGMYHLQEAKEIAFDIQNWQIPSFTHLYGILGTATLTEYPWLSLIPFIVGYLIHIPVKIVFIIYSLFVFDFTANIIYYIVNHYLKNQKWAVLCAVLSTFTLAQYNAYDVDDFAVLVAMPLIFIAILGWIRWIKRGQWLTLVFSMTSLVYLNIVSAYEVLLTLILLSCISLSQINKQKIINGIKAVLLTMGLTAMIWGPLVILNLSNKLYVPITKTMFLQDNISKLALTWFSLPYASIFITVAMIPFWTHLSFLQHKIIIVLMILTICTVLPANVLACTPFIVLQFMFRLSNITNILALILVIPFLKAIYVQKSNSHIIIFSSTCIVLQLILSLTMISATNMAFFIEQPFMSHTSVNRGARTTQRMFMHYNTAHKIDTVAAYQNKLYNNDYVPLALVQKLNKKIPSYISKKENASESYNSAFALQHQMKKKHYAYIKNGISIDNNQVQHNVRLPIITYHGQKYHFYLNHHAIKPTYKNHEIVLRDLPKGKNVVTYTTPTMMYRYISIIISIFSLIYFGHLYKNAKGHKEVH